MNHTQPAQLLPDILGHLLQPVERLMPLGYARDLVALRATPEVQARIDELAEKCNEGLPDEAERAEYEAIVEAIDFLSLLQAHGRAVLARPSES